MKKLFLLSLFLLALKVDAQQLIAVESGGTSKFYENLDTAIVHAQPGATVYIPGGSFQTTNLIIDKPLNIIGAGSNPDSSVATGITFIAGSITFAGGSDNSHLEGIYLSFGIQLGSNSTDQISSFKLIRCNISSLILSKGTSLQYNSSIYISENIIRVDIRGNSGTTGGPINVILKQNIIGGTVGTFSNASFENNIFLGANSTTCGTTYGYYFTFINNCIFRNNVILTSYFGFTCASNNNSLYNNLIRVGFNSSGVIANVNNIFNVVIDSIFINYPAFSQSFDYKYDFHLKSNCKGRNAGTDGTDVGIYGTSTPFKSGSIPYNPHFGFSNVGNATNQSGNLQVNLRIIAQDR